MNLLIQKIEFTLLFSCLTLAGYPQLLKGKIFDSETTKPVHFATIFFSETSAGTFSDEEGNFMIDISRYQGMPLTISALGYNSETIRDISPELPYLVYLSPKIYELSDVIVEGKRDGSRWKWRAKMSTFRKQFLGETLNASRCRITNESDIYLSANGDLLKAFAYKPLLIKNEALGYTITYFLDKFEYDPVRPYLMIAGNIIFSDDLLEADSKTQAKAEKKRKTAYLGSRMHFFRCLWANNLDTSGFTIREDKSNKKLNYEDFVVETDSSGSVISSKYLKNVNSINIAYFSMVPRSSMTIYKEPVYIDSSGYSNPLNVSWYGDMAKQRIGDMLPLDYQP